MVWHLPGPVLSTDGQWREDAWIDEGRITYRAPSARAEQIPGWVVPGLVDVHCHIGLDSGGEVDRSTAEDQAVAARNTGMLLARDAGVPSDTQWMQERLDLPRIVRSGRHIARPKRYLRYFAEELPQVSDLPEAVAHQARRSQGWVKLVADWIDRDVGDLTPLWPTDILRDAVARAHELGVRVTAHTFSHEALPGLLEAGIDGIEHACGADQELAAEIASRGIPVTPTLLQVDTFLDIAAQAGEKYPIYGQRMRNLHAQRYETVKMLFDAGVQLYVGTDAGGTLRHGLIAQEAAEMVRAGIPTSEVWAAATWKGREFLRAPALEEGDPADLIIYDRDPLQDINTMREPSSIFLNGKPIAF